MLNLPGKIQFDHERLTLVTGARSPRVGKTGQKGDEEGVDEKENREGMEERYVVA